MLNLKLARCPTCSLLPSRLYLVSRWSHELDWGGVGYSRSVATGGSARVATGKRRGGAGADRIGQDLHLRAAYPNLKTQAVFTVPTRALANDKLSEWRARGWDVGISTGDVALN